MVDVAHVEHHQAPILIQVIETITFEAIEIGFFDRARRSGRVAAALRAGPRYLRSSAVTSLRATEPAALLRSVGGRRAEVALPFRELGSLALARAPAAAAEHSAETQDP